MVEVMQEYTSGFWSWLGYTVGLSFITFGVGSIGTRVIRFPKMN